MNITILFRTTIMLLLVASLASCSEELKYEKEDTTPPVVNNFSPKSGKIGTDVLITGDFLKAIDTIRIGGGMALLKYKINSGEIVATIVATSRSGKVEASGKHGASTSSDIFTVNYVVPQVSEVPAIGVVNGGIIIKGVDLDAALDVYFGNEKGTIMTKSADKMEVRVPYCEDRYVDLTIAYFDGSQYKRTPAISIEIDKKEPIVLVAPSNAKAGHTMTITGRNMTQVESIKIGDYPATIIEQSATSIKMKVSILYAATAQVTGEVTYGNGAKTAAFPNPVNMATSGVYYDKNVKIFGPAASPNFYNPITGIVYGPCDWMNQKANTQCFITIGGSAIQLNNPANGTNYNNFSCSGTALASPGAAILFKKLDANNPAEKVYIDKVIGETLESVSATELETAGVVKPTRHWVRYNGIATPTPSTYEIGSVILFYKYPNTSYTTPDNVGFMYVTAVETTNAATDKGSALIFNYYYQK